MCHWATASLLSRAEMEKKHLCAIAWCVTWFMHVLVWVQLHTTVFSSALNSRNYYWYVFYCLVYWNHSSCFLFFLLLKTADICQGLDCSVMKFSFFLYYRTKWQNKWMLWSKGYERLVENFMTQLTVSYQFPNYLIPIIVKYLVLCLFCESDGLTRNLNNCLNIKLYHNARWCSGQTT